MSNRSRQRKSLRIRATSFRSWFNANLKANARDIASHGADCGFPSISYTSDTVCIFDRFADEIWAMAVADAEELGHANVCEMIAGFKRPDMLADYDCFKNLMVWYACEKLAGERESPGASAAQPGPRRHKPNADLRGLSARRPNWAEHHRFARKKSVAR